MSRTTTALLSVALVGLLAGCSGAPRSARSGPNNTNYVMGFPLESASPRAQENVRDPMPNTSYDMDRQRQMEEDQERRAQEQQDRQDQQRMNDMDRVQNNNEHCLSCP